MGNILTNIQYFAIPFRWSKVAPDICPMAEATETVPECDITAHVTCTTAPPLAIYHTKRYILGTPATKFHDQLRSAYYFSTPMYNTRRNIT